MTNSRPTDKPVRKAIDTDVVSERIRERIRKAKRRFHANDNIASYIHDGELAELQLEVRERVQALLESLVIDTKNDHNSEGTADRLAKMFLQETMAGRYTPQPKITDFPNASNLDQLYCVGPIRVNSMCSHHHVPIVGEAYIGIFPGERVLGLSKFKRLSDWIMRRPQIQEEATTMLADEIERLLKPQGLAVLVKSRHFCMGWRGVMDDGTLMTTSVMRGVLQETAFKTEFLKLVEMNSIR